VLGHPQLTEGGICLRNRPLFTHCTVKCTLGLLYIVQCTLYVPVQLQSVITLRRGSIRQGWAIAHFENVQLLFLTCEKVRFWNFTYFLHIYAHCSYQKSNCAIAHLKNAKYVRLHNRTFSKSDKKCNRTISLFKERQKVGLHIHTFLKSEKKCNHTIALSKWANMRKKCKFWNNTFSQLKKRDRTIALWKRANECMKMSEKVWFPTCTFFCS